MVRDWRQTDYEATRYINDYVAKGILISPMYIYNKNAVALWGVGGGVVKEFV